MPDISEEQLKSVIDADGIMPFSQISSSEAVDEQHEEPPIELINSVAKGLRDATKLRLFNFDMIKDVKAS
ncbi:hypothetical protein PJI21_29145, partial [Mycobacterium kansasii]